MSKIGLIGGTGANLFAPLGRAGMQEIFTVYSPDPVVLTTWHSHGHEVLFLPRHGAHAQTPPHKVNYRGNIAALKKAGVEQIIAMNAVGGINAAGGAPGTLTLPDQLIDYTHGREHTFYDGEHAQLCSDIGLPGELTHVEFTLPFDETLRRRLLQAATAAGIIVTPSATCGVMQGPRLETAAEIDRLERDGCHIVGMTSAPEASLAAEAGIPYACIAGIVNYAAGRAPVDADGQQQPIHAQMGALVEHCMTGSHALLQAFLAETG
jgi:5'-methylthioinosine phosphorylase